MEDVLKKRQDKGRQWWELRACAYWDRLNEPKIVYQEIYQISDLVNAAYGLTPHEIALIWRTAPPRMPIIGP